MTTQHSPFAKPKFTAEDFARADDYGSFAEDTATPRAPIEETRTFRSDDDDRRTAYVAPALNRGIGSDPVMERELDREDAMLLDRPVREEAPTFAAAPIYASKTRKASSGIKIPTAALVAIPAVVLLAGAGYMAMSTGGNQGLSSKTAGEPTAVASSTVPAAPAFSEPTQVASADVPPPVNPVNPAAPPTTAPAQAAPRVSEAAPSRVARARPAPAAVASASSAGVDASATLPAAPIPYSGTAQGAATAPAALAPAPIVIPPVTAAPTTPAPTVEAPAAEVAPAAPEVTPSEAPETPMP